MSNDKNTWQIYPNPTHFTLIVEHTPSVKTLEIVNPLGKVLKMVKPLSEAVQTEIGIVDLPNGIYFLRNNEGNIFRFVKL